VLGLVEDGAILLSGALADALATGRERAGVKEGYALP
jgi:hypothetical protein